MNKDTSTMTPVSCEKKNAALSHESGPEQSPFVHPSVATVPTASSTLTAISQKKRRQLGKHIRIARRPCRTVPASSVWFVQFASSRSAGSMASQPTEKQIIEAYTQLQQELQAVQQKLFDIDNKFQEHTLVICALEPLSKDRKCFRLMGGVLVERTVGEVVPVLQTNVANLKKVRVPRFCRLIRLVGVPLHCQSQDAAQHSGCTTARAGELVACQASGCCTCVCIFLWTACL